MIIPEAPEGEFATAAAEIKVSVWGYPEPDSSYLDLWSAKFEPDTGDIREGFTTEEYMRKRMAGLRKTSSRYAHTVTRP